MPRNGTAKCVRPEGEPNISLWSLVGTHAVILGECSVFFWAMVFEAPWLVTHGTAHARKMEELSAVSIKGL